MRCSACSEYMYCSKECQKYDWKHGGHRELCKEIVSSRKGSCWIPYSHLCRFQHPGYRWEDIFDFWSKPSFCRQGSSAWPTATRQGVVWSRRWSTASQARHRTTLWFVLSLLHHTIGRPIPSRGIWHESESSPTMGPNSQRRPEISSKTSRQNDNHTRLLAGWSKWTIVDEHYDRCR